MEVCVVSLSQAGLDGNPLQELILGLPEHCIALMEDIDAVFHYTLSQDLPGEGEAPEEAESLNRPTAPRDQSSRVSLSGLFYSF